MWSRDLAVIEARSVMMMMMMENTLYQTEEEQEKKHRDEDQPENSSGDREDISNERVSEGGLASYTKQQRSRRHCGGRCSLLLKGNGFY